LRLESAVMEVLAILVGGGVVAVVLCSWLAGGDRPGRSSSAERTAGSGPLGLRSAHEILEAREELEAEDLAQLLEACNARRRRRGEPERTIEDVELQLTREQHDAWPAA
jgi:hypothetical protein